MILDTCALIWLAQGEGRLTPATCQRIEEAPLVLVSAISAFEIGIKHRKGKLRLPASPKEWFQTVVEHHDLRIIPLDAEICLCATQLPAIHSDPCDRFIIATAKLHGLQVVTRDSIFAQYGLRILE
jgi:PIN domain nuclease of toxin-antitoxin system